MFCGMSAVYTVYMLLFKLIISVSEWNNDRVFISVVLGIQAAVSEILRNNSGLQQDLNQ